MIRLEIGQVWAHRDYFKIITECSDFVIRFEFYNRKEHYFKPNYKRVNSKDNHPSHIEVTQPTREVRSQINRDKLTLMESYHGKKPEIGIDGNIKRDYLYHLQHHIPL